MSESEQAAAEKAVDRELAETLVSRSFSAEVIHAALEGVGEKRARGVLDWARGTEDPEKALKAWALKRRSPGECGYVREREVENAPERARGRLHLDAIRHAYRLQIALDELLARRKAEAEPQRLPGYYEANIRAEIAQANLSGRSGRFVSDGASLEQRWRNLRLQVIEEFPLDDLEMAVTGLKPKTCFDDEHYAALVGAYRSGVEEEIRRHEKALEEMGYRRDKIYAARGKPWEPAEFDR